MYFLMQMFSTKASSCLANCELVVIVEVRRVAINGKNGPCVCHGVNVCVFGLWENFILVGK